MRDKTIDLIDKEMHRQHAKWGQQNHHYDYWLGIAMEELGEVAKEVIDRHGRESVKREVVQVAAVLCTWLEHIERQEVRDG